MNASISSSQLCHELVIGGITPFTTIDFPGRLAAVLYTQGCTWNCRYCHNTHLQPFQSPHPIPFRKVLDFLENRLGLLDGVVFCGGEPTAQAGLGEAMRAVKALGFQVALHTAGIYPDPFREVLPLCDWVGMDIKAPFDCYEKITQTKNSGASIRQSLKALLESGVDHEIRTTWHPALLSEAEILEMAKELSGMGVERYVIQGFQPKGCGDSGLKGVGAGREIMSAELRSTLSSLFNSFMVR